ncbi:hypothetical protein [Mucilaginibacter sp.]
MPKNLLNSGFIFNYETIEAAVTEILSTK